MRADADLTPALNTEPTVSSAFAFSINLLRQYRRRLPCDERREDLAERGSSDLLQLVASVADRMFGVDQPPEIDRCPGDDDVAGRIVDRRLELVELIGRVTHRW